MMAPPSRSARVKTVDSFAHPVRAFLLGRTWSLAALGALLYWAALPPLGLWPLAWAAPVPWMLLIRRRELAPPGPNIPAACDEVHKGLLARACRCFNRILSFLQSAYGQLWVVGFFFWLAAVHWLRLPHPATAVGWVALSLYLGCYLPLFIGLSRVAVHRLRIPVWAVAPCVWMGLELARAHLITGFTMAALEHTQLPFLLLLQLADITGQYGVGGVMMFVAAAAAEMIPLDGRWSWKPAGVVAVVLAAVVGYGSYRMGQVAVKSAPAARIALIQGSIDVTIPPIANCTERTYSEYGSLSMEAAQHGPLDLLVWPETVWPYPVVEFEEGLSPPDDWRGTPEEYEQWKREVVADSRAAIASLARATDSPLLLGLGTYRLSSRGEERLNSAQLVSRSGELQGRYDKMHLVLFGEYVPILGNFPDYNILAPVCPETTPGDGPECFEVGSTTIAPSICYETVIPHLIRRQITTLARQGREPEVLINLTNDGWFWGSSELDMHLACGVFRAIEARKPLLIAANTGFSASIDGSGRILERGPRRTSGVIIADVVTDPRRSPYLVWGDWLPGVCLLACVVIAVAGLRRNGSPAAQDIAPEPLRAAQGAGEGAGE